MGKRRSRRRRSGRPTPTYWNTVQVSGKWDDSVPVHRMTPRTNIYRQQSPATANQATSESSRIRFGESWLVTEVEVVGFLQSNPTRIDLF